jgi:hypothetical protein
MFSASLSWGERHQEGGRDIKKAGETQEAGRHASTSTRLHCVEFRTGSGNSIRLDPFSMVADEVGDSRAIRQTINQTMCAMEITRPTVDHALDIVAGRSVLKINLLKNHRIRGLKVTD